MRHLLRLGAEDQKDRVWRSLSARKKTASVSRTVKTSSDRDAVGVLGELNCLLGSDGSLYEGHLPPDATTRFKRVRRLGPLAKDHKVDAPGARGECPLEQLMCAAVRWTAR